MSKPPHRDDDANSSGSETESESEEDEDTVSFSHLYRNCLSIESLKRFVLDILTGVNRESESTSLHD